MRPRAWLTMAALLLIATACGDTGEPATTAPTSPPPAPATTAAPATTSPPAVVTTTTVPAPTTTTTSPPPTSPPTTVAAPPEWRLVDAGDSGPEPRSNPVMAFDPGARALYLHGGRTGGSSRADLWRFDLDAMAWTELTPDGPAPEPRFSHTAIWDTRRNRFVIFSGEGAGFGDFFSDVWAYDPAAGAWEELAPDGAGPADRYGSCAGYDPAGDRFLITHGFTDSGRFDDTWAFSLAAASWTDVTPDGALPGARCLHACSYEAASASLVMFGGQDDDQPFLGDTWVLAAGGWTEAASGPSPRKFPATAAVPGGILLFGGIGADGETADTWRYTPADSAWTLLAPAASPAPRESHAAATDPESGEVYVFGGQGPAGEVADLWAFAPGS